MDRGWQNAYIGFCPSIKAWYRMFKEFNIEPTPYPDTDACTTTLDIHEPGKHKYVIVVTVHDRFDKKYKTDRPSVAGLLAHEATHAWQHVLKNMGEFDRPKGEIEAYAIQHIFMNLYDSYLTTRIRKK